MKEQVADLVGLRYRLEGTALDSGRRTEQKGEEFARLATAELSGCYRLAARILGDEGEAEDAVNEAVLRAWNGFGGLRDPDRFGPWLSRIVVNTCRNVLQRRQVVRMEPIGDLEPEDDRDRFADSQERDEVAKAIDLLSPEQRIVVVLRYWNDLPVDEIARLVGVPSGTVKWRLHTACRHLRDSLGAAGWEGAER